MEKIIFFGLAIPILAFVIYLGGGAIMKGFSAKVSNRPNKDEDENQKIMLEKIKRLKEKKSKIILKNFFLHQHVVIMVQVQK